MKKQKRIIFVQGFGDYSDRKWPKWLGQEAVKNDFEFLNMQMPDPMIPELYSWLEALQKEKNNLNEDTYFVGHSLGCITIVRFLETLPKKIKVGGCIFVAGFCDFPKIPLLADFCVLPINWEKVKAVANNIFAIISDDDKMVPLIDAKNFANKLGAEIILENNKGHFMNDVKEMPSVLNCILEMDQMQAEFREIKDLRKLSKKK